MTSAAALLIATLALFLSLSWLFVVAVMLLMVRFFLPQGESGNWEFSESGLARNEDGIQLRMEKPALLMPWVTIVKARQPINDTEFSPAHWHWFWRDSMDSTAWSRLRRVALNINS